jgi:hypothetical protein
MQVNAGSRDGRVGPRFVLFILQPTCHPCTTLDHNFQLELSLDAS